MSEPDAAPNPYAPPGVEITVADPVPEAIPTLWNPDAAGAWSLFFTPVFGSYLVLKNWQTLGRQVEVKLAWMWLVASAVLLIPMAFVPRLNLLFIVVWYFAWQKKQTDYVKKRWGRDYIRKGWGAPLLGGVAGLVVYTVIVIAVTLLMRR